METQARFVTTHWSLVLKAADPAAPGAARSLELLCGAYWYPLYAFVRRQGYGPEAAEDLTQAFFARLMEKGTLANVNRDKGRFRTFLLVCLRRFMTNEWEKETAKKRGGGLRRLRLDLRDAEARYAGEPQWDLTAEKIYQRRWALTVLERACDALQQEFVRAGKDRLFGELKDFLAGSSGAPPYPEVAARLGMSEAAVRVAAHRLRERYREAIRDEIRATVETEAEIDDEIRELFKTLAE